jgi:hypothetical protein
MQRKVIGDPIGKADSEFGRSHEHLNEGFNEHFRHLNRRCTAATGTSVSDAPLNANTLGAWM